jgi:hypothetical protein
MNLRFSGRHGVVAQSIISVTWKVEIRRFDDSPKKLARPSTQQISQVGWYILVILAMQQIVGRRISF